MKKSAFTLIELLVVISIIAILAGIALPVFGKVMEKSRATSCASNLKQLGLGVAAFLNDNDEKMFEDPPKDGASVWAKTLQDKYVTNWKVFRSPFDKRTQSGNVALVSYGVNAEILTQSAKPAWDGNFSKVISPSQLILAAPHYELDKGLPENPTSWGTSDVNTEKTGNVLPKGGQGMKKGTNTGRINALFADSHVESLAFTTFTDSTSSPAGIRRWYPIKEATTP